MKTRRDEIGGLEWYARNPEHAIHGMRKMVPEQRGIYNDLLDRIYLSGDRLEDDDARLAALNKCHIRVYRRVKAYLIQAEKISLEDVDGTVFIRNEAASKEVVRGRSLVEQATVNGSLGGQVTAAKLKQMSSKNKPSRPATAAPTAQATAQHLNKNSNKNLSDRQESPAAREVVAAHPEGCAPPSTPALDQHPESAVRAFAANLEPEELAAWTAYGATIERTGKSWTLTTTSAARQGMVQSRLGSKLKASLQNYTITAPDSQDITST